MEKPTLAPKLSNYPNIGGGITPALMSNNPSINPNFLNHLYRKTLPTMKNNIETAKNIQETENKESFKVILADDDIDDQEIFMDALSQTNIPVDLTTVNNGKELLDNLKDPSEPNPDIIFMDINMPGKNGKEVLAEIKSDETLKEIPTVMLSTSENVKDIEDTYNAGANLYVPKPASFRNFILLLKKIFTLHWAGVLLKPLRNAFHMSERNIS